MRFHTNTLTSRDIYDACRKAGVSAPILSPHGSRSRARAFEIQLSGDSPYRSQGHGEHAATWDQWGVFMAYLFSIDPGLIIGGKNWGYSDPENFHRRTANRFVSLNLPHDTHPRHKWWGDGTGEGQYCRGCTATFAWR